MTRNKSDNLLGEEVHKHLVSLGIETPCNYELKPNMASLRSDFEAIMQQFGLQTSTDDSLRDTPSRVASMYIEEAWMGLNYLNFPKCTTIENKMKVDEVIVIKDISVLSMCEHHLVPFIGKAAVGYIPDKKVMGLSKFNRIVDFFSRRPQVQERLTEQIYAALSYILKTENVAVIIEAEHLCVKMRGVRDHSSSTVTSKMGGHFMNKPAARQEFLSLAKKS